MLRVDSRKFNRLVNDVLVQETQARLEMFCGLRAFETMS